MARLVFEDWIVYEDEHYIVINKPPYVATLNDRVDNYNLLEMARDFHSGAKVCHRLDKETSGVLVMAKDDEAYRSVAIQLEKREVDKIYHAVVEGIHDFKDVLIEAPIRQMSNGHVKITPEGHPASTLVDVVTTYRWHTLVRCKPVTGRMHQIRAHLSAAKAPIISDQFYHGNPVYLSSLKKNFNLGRGKVERPIIQRLALHALKIRFLDLSGKMKEIEAPYPKDFKVLLKQLERYR